MPRLSTEFLETEALSPSTGQIIYRDDDLLGFGIRVTPKAKSYIVEKRFNGVNRRITIGRFPALSADEARVIASKTLSTMAIGIDPKTGKRAAPSTTLREVFDKYITVRRLRTETLRVYQGLFRNNFSDWLDKPIVSITKDMIQERHKTISSGTSKGTTGQATADNACKLLQSVLNFANEHYADEDQPLFKVNPVSRLSRDKQWYRLPPRSRIIPDDKLSGWYQAVRSLDNVTAQDYFLTLLFTGFRKTEAMSLTWDDIDLNRKIISIPAHVTKSNRTHVVPMCDFLYELLRARHSGREKENKFVFPGRNQQTRLTDLRRFFVEIQLKSGVVFSRHDLRRTFITMAEKLDVPHLIIRRLANHQANTDITSNYIIVDPERLREPVNRIGNQFVRLMGADIDNLFLWRRSDNETSDGSQLRLGISLHAPKS